MNKTKKTPTAARLKIDFEAACNAYLKAFCEKHDYDYEDAARSWTGGEVGDITEACDFFVDMTTIRTDIDQNAPEEEFVKWYDYCLRLGSLSTATVNIPTPNFRSWLMGCPRKSEEWFTEIEKLHQRTEQAKRDLEECIKQEGF